MTLLRIDHSIIATQKFAQPERLQASSKDPKTTREPTAPTALDHKPTASAPSDIDPPSLPNFHPSTLPNLRTLILTCLPALSPTPTPSETLTTFLRSCATRSSRAQTLARKEDYTAPPGRANLPSTLRQTARSIFPLERVVLEVAQPPPPPPSSSPSVSMNESTSAARQKQNQQRHHRPPGTSVTQDHDSEVFWAAAAGDFSFFAHDDESNHRIFTLAQPTHRKDASAVPPESTPPPLPTHSTRIDPPIDTIARIATFRKQAKEAYHKLLSESRGGDDDDDNDDSSKKSDLQAEAEARSGWWGGVVQVVRVREREGEKGMKREEEDDYFGRRWRMGGMG